jgi:hypothetical protein
VFLAFIKGLYFAIIDFFSKRSGYFKTLYRFFLFYSSIYSLMMLLLEALVGFKRIGENL